jgi:hypothetical protein
MIYKASIMPKMTPYLGTTVKTAIMPVNSGNNPLSVESNKAGLSLRSHRKTLKNLTAVTKPDSKKVPKKTLKQYFLYFKNKSL